MDKLYDYLNELSRCEWKADGSLGITYNGISDEYGVEYYNQVLSRMNENAEMVLLRLSDDEKRAFKAKIKDILEFPYDIITYEYVDCLKRDSIGGLNKKDIQLGEHVVGMFGIQHYYRQKLFNFISNLCGDMSQNINNNIEVNDCEVNEINDNKDNENNIKDNEVIKGVNGLASFLSCCGAIAQAVINSNILGEAQYKVGNRWYFDIVKLKTKLNDNPQLLKDIHIKRRVK